jgi:porin
MVMPSAARAGSIVESWFAQDTASGDWGGLRSRAEAAGLTVEGNYQTDLLGNPVGGEKHGFAYAGLAEIALDFDLETIAGLEGTSFFISGYWASGRDLSDRDIGNAIDVSQVYDGRSVRLGAVYLEQDLLDGALNMVAGRISTGDDFATSDLYDNYVSSGVNGNPFALGGNVPSFTEDSVATWGVRALARPIEQVHVAVGVYDAEPNLDKNSKNGVDFTFDPQNGVLTFAETGYHWQQAKDDTGLPGNATFGGYFDSSDYEYLDGSGRTRDGNYGFYLLLDQMVYREGGPGSDQGLTPWAAFTLAPDDKVNTFPYSVSGGVQYQGLIPSRDDDVASLGVYHGKFSDKLEDQNGETVIEVDYLAQLTPWLYAMPDFQYVIRPNGDSSIDSAAVFGSEIGIDF